MLRKVALAALAASFGQQTLAWPDTPFSTAGRYIYDECGNEVRFAGVNWPGAAETMLPEGLQYASIADTVSKIKSLGMNIIRLTYAIEMIDDIYDNIDSSINGSLYKGVGEGSAPGVLAGILQHNPQFTAETTRLEVYDAIAEECAKQELWIHLDNHQSRAYWCCPQWDGNAWFDDSYFPVYNWTRGLGFMADHTKNWEALVSMSLRNELRPSITQAKTLQPYNWTTWVNNMMPAAAVINGNNSLPLIYLSGINWDTSLQLLITGVDQSTGQTFNPEDYPFEDKLLYEIHNYANGVSCDGLTSGFYSGAYGAMNASDPAYPNKKPVVLSEFGFGQDDGSDQGVYAQCIKNYLTGLPGGPGSWMQWVLAGSYYTRTGAIDSDETWGLLNHNWTAWRNQTVIDEYVKPFIDATLAGL